MNSGAEDEAEPKFEQYFEAELNAEQWEYEGKLRASLMNLHRLPWFNVYAYNPDSANTFTV